MKQSLFLTKAKESLFLFFKGIAIGAADVVPGVSGGTIAFIVGIYERLLLAIAKIPTTIKTCIKFKQIKHITHLDWNLFVPLGMGIGTAFLLLSSLISKFLQTIPDLMFAFFTGLILASAILLISQTKTKKPLYFFYAIFAAMISFIITTLTTTNLPSTLPIMFLSGFIAICAMLLPGISGSYLLVVLGQYGFVINAIHQRDILIIAVFGFGAICGLLSVAKILHYLFKKYHDPMLFVLTGVMLGALKAPVQEVLLHFSSWTLVSLAALVGAILVFLLQFLRRQKTPQNQNN